NRRLIDAGSGTAAGAGARVAERLAGDRDVFPVLGGFVQLQLQDAVGGVVANFAVGEDGAETVRRDTAEAGDELTDTVVVVAGAVGTLRREPLVRPIVRVDDDFGLEIIQRVPGRLHRVVDAVGRGEPRMVEDGNRATLASRREIVAQPLLLRRADRHREIAVQENDVPETEVDTVIALVALAGLGAPVVPVGRAARGPGIERSDDRTGAALMPPPRRAVAVDVVGEHAGRRVRAVAGHEYDSLDVVEQCRRGFVVRLVAAGNIAGSDQHLEWACRCGRISTGKVSRARRWLSSAGQLRKQREQPETAEESKPAVPTCREAQGAS